MASKSQTLPELLADLVELDPLLPLYRFLVDGESVEERMECQSLHSAAMQLSRSIAERTRSGDRVLIIAPPGLDFIRGFFGIQYAGRIVVATFPPHPRRIEKTLHRLQSIVASSKPSLLVMTSELIPLAERLGLPFIPIDTTIESDHQYLESGLNRSLRQIDPDSPAMIQYTSGSTREPRGVVLSHRNLLDNLRFIAERFGHHRNSCGVIWLPPYHDMGLIGGILQPLYVGFPVVLLNPLHVLQRPSRWLAAITKYSATTSGGPNFAFDTCIDSIDATTKSQLRLDSWEVAFCGAETVRPSTWRRFSDAFAEVGFRREAFFPCYGLAEVTLMVSGSHRLSMPKTSASPVPSGRRLMNATSSCKEIMSCGTPDGDHQITIFDVDTGKPISDGKVGEICISGASVAKGYWDDPSATAEQFSGCGSSPSNTLLKTGDLGFIEEGELYVTGRIKDLIILSGKNHYSQDLECTIENSHADFHSNGACAFAMENNEGEKLVVLVELPPSVRRDVSDKLEEWTIAIQRSLSAEHDIRCDDLCFVKQGAIPKTSSGKKQRDKCRDKYIAGEIDRLEPNAVLSSRVLHTIPVDRNHVNPTPKGIHRAIGASKRFQQRLTWIMVVTPILGLIGAVVISWGSGIHPVDLIGFVGLYVLTVFGIEVGFHRHFSHRSFQATSTVRTILCILGSMAAQGPVLFWVATHRRHHAFSDQAEDPHSPNQSGKNWIGRVKGLWNAHLGWLFKAEVTSPMEYAPDVLRDPLVFKLNQWYPMWVVMGLILPGLLSMAATGTWVGFMRGFLWGGLVRVLFVHHATWSVNSICHMFGSRAFTTRDQSRNNGWLAISSLGGSWHNNHHAFPNSAYTGLTLWQFDPSGMLIRCLAWSGLVWDVKRPNLRTPFSMVAPSEYSIDSNTGNERRPPVEQE